MMERKKWYHTPFLVRLTNWEYWPFTAVYGPIYPIMLYYCLKAKSFFFYTASNPSIKNGGFLNESKKDIHPIIPPAHAARTLFFDLPQTASVVIEKVVEAGLTFPLIGKPNIGARGRGVKILKTEADIATFVKSAALDFHIQEYIEYENEIGLFYYRFPGANKGTLSGIVRKEFLSVIGDGKQTVSQLLHADKRSLMYLSALTTLAKDQLDQIPLLGEKRIISPFGNHARGALFLDDSHLIDQELIDSFDAVCKQIPDFYFGRLDIRYKSWEELKKGANFIIIEVNGAGAEPTHMYDPKHSLFYAWKEILRHWKILYKISTANHSNGVPYLSYKEGVAMLREDKEWSKKLEAMPL